MATGGLHTTVEQAKAEKAARNEKLDKELRTWVETTLGESLSGPLGESLKDGTVLCRLINKIRPNTIRKINKDGTPFKQRENIENYLLACQALGMEATDCFPVVDLFEQRDFNTVLANLSVLRQLAPKIDPNAPLTAVTSKRTSGKSLLLNSDAPSRSPRARAQSMAVPAPSSATRRPSGNSPKGPGTPHQAPSPHEPAAPVQRLRRGSTVTPPTTTPTLNHTLQQKKMDKYDKELEDELRRWIQAVLGEPMPQEQSFAELLRDGTVLCRLINKLKPGTVKKINEQKIPFKQMENIEAYLKACKELGIAELESFNTIDLYEEKDMNLVLVQLSTLATHAGKIPSWTGSATFNEKLLGDKKSKKKEPRLIRLTRKGDLERAKAELAGRKASLSDTNKLGQTVLHVAAELGQQDFMEWYLSQPGTDINHKDKDGYTALINALQHLRFDSAEFLIEKGTDVRPRGNDGTTVLHHLARLPPSAAVGKLLDAAIMRGAAIEAADNYGETALMVAAGSMNDVALLTLLKRGANPNAVNLAGETALHKAARLVEQDEAAMMLCKALVDKGVNPQVKAASGSALDLLPPAARAEMERHIDPTIPDKLQTPRSLLEVRTAQQKKTDVTPRGAQAKVVPDPAYRIELGTKTPLDIELIQMPYHYRWNFAGRKHTNFAGFLDEELTDAAIISVMEEMPGSARVLIRTKEGAVESVVPLTKQPFSAEAVLNDLIAKRPAWKLAVFQQVDNLKLQSDLLDFEEHDPQRTFRFPIGVVYSAPGNVTQWDMWDNEHGSKEFDQFCAFLGDRIKLKGWTGYTGGLDVKNDTKGTESVFSKFHGFDIMFHISTLLPYEHKDERKLARSRMIGNDITMIIYQEGDTPYAPTTMTGGVSRIARSLTCLDVFVLVRPVKDKQTGQKRYAMSCISKDYVPPFKPDIPEPGLFDLDELFRNLLLTKLINGHSAAQTSPGLRMMYNRPRQAMLEDLAKAYCKNLLQRLQKDKKKERPRGLQKFP